MSTGPSSRRNDIVYSQREAESPYQMVKKMWTVLLQNSAALVTLFIFVSGNGFYSTFIASILSEQGASSFTIGLMTTGFYGGLVVGSFRIERLIARVSHIRAYAAFASMMAVIPLLHGLIDDIIFWFFLRFIAGIATAGVFIVVESWLLTMSTLSSRGQMLALYMVTFYASQSLGQQFLRLYDNNAMLLFAVISITSSLSILPVAITRAETPSYAEPSTLKLSQIFSKCASGLVGCFLAGMLLGTIYGLFPVYFTLQFEEPALVASLMSIIIFGGMLLQYPVGKLSDVYERRIVLFFTALLSIGVLIVMQLFTQSFYTFAALCALFGGLVFTLYPVSISYACDSLSTADIVAGTQTLLLSYSIGSMSGPLVAALFMKYDPYYGLFVYMMAILAVLALFLGWRKTVKASNPHEEAFIAYPQNSPIGCEADPRGEPAIDTGLASEDSSSS